MAVPNLHHSRFDSYITFLTRVTLMAQSVARALSNQKVRIPAASPVLFGNFVRCLVESSWVLYRIKCSSLSKMGEARVMSIAPTGVGDLSLKCALSPII